MCPGTNSTKGLTTLNAENYKTLLKEIVEDTNNWEDSPCPQINIILFKLSTTPV
jgi:hypothetical protein